MNLEKLLSELEAKAKAASSTDAPWFTAYDMKRYMDSVDADFTSAANPSTIERLISIIRRLEEAVKAEHYCGEPGVICDSCVALADVERIAGGV